MSEYYWRITQFDGTETDVKPDAVEVVKRRMAENQPINTRTAVIPANQIKSFKITERPYNPEGQEVPLLESASQAFNEPVYTDEGEIKVRWVKKQVPQEKYNRYYSSLPGYRRLPGSDSLVTIAFRLPVHLIDVNATPYCSEEETKYLNTKQ